VSQVKN